MNRSTLPVVIPPAYGLQRFTQAPPDLVTPKLPALRDYQLSLPAPEPPNGSFDRAAAGRGTGVFNGVARCNTCHKQPAFTDVVKGPNDSTPLRHAPPETGMDPGPWLHPDS